MNSCLILALLILPIEDNILWLNIQRALDIYHTSMDSSMEKKDKNWYNFLFSCFIMQ